MDLCRYKNSLGEPGKGFHQARLGSFALWDVAGTLIIIIVLILLGFGTLQTIITVGVLTVGLHWLFCVPTAGNIMLGL